MTPAAVFDQMAAEYDAQWTNTAVGRAQRDQVWRVMDALFARGSRVLDVGCGTGEDALHLMARGVDVQGVDESAAMVAIARASGVAAEVGRAEDLLSELRSDAPTEVGAQTEVCPTWTFDGALSNFGALNCVADLPAVARELGRVVRPGGRVAICLIGRFCLWESLYYGMRMQFGKALRRRPASSYRGMTVYYPTVREVRAAFVEGFALRQWRGVGLLVPPSYVQLPGVVVRALSVCDRVLARLPLLRAMADHRLFVLVRK